MASLVPWLKEALEQGQAAVAATAPAHIDLLRDGLGSDASKVAFIDQDEWYLRPAMTIAGWKEWLTKFAQRGFEYTRAIGEVKLRSDRSHTDELDQVRIEPQRCFPGCSTWIVCPYDMRSLPKFIIEEVWRTHPTVWNANRQASDRYVDPATLLTNIPEPMPAVVGDPFAELRIGTSPVEVRKRAREAGVAARLSTERIDDLLVALNEIVANSITHGRGPSECASGSWRTASSVR